MYEILKDIGKITYHSIIVLYEPTTRTKFPVETLVPLDGISVEFLDETIALPLENYKEEWDTYYQNLTLKGSKLKTDLIIYQDYGIGESYVPDNYVELPVDLLVPGSIGNIGWYDGYLCWMNIQAGVFLVVKLLKFDKDEFLKGKEISEKCPYDFRIIVDKGFNMNDKVRCCLSFLDEPWNILDFEIPITLKDLLNPENLDNSFYSSGTINRFIRYNIMYMQDCLKENGFHSEKPILPKQIPQARSGDNCYIEWSHPDSKTKVTEVVKGDYEVDFLVEKDGVFRRCVSPEDLEECILSS